MYGPVYLSTREHSRPKVCMSDDPNHNLNILSFKNSIQLFGEFYDITVSVRYPFTAVI